MEMTDSLPTQPKPAPTALASDEIAELLASFLLIHWRGIPRDFKQRYRADVWRIFTNTVIVAANHTSSLHRFSHMLCSRLGIEVGETKAARKELLQIFESNLDRLFLKTLREDAEYIILLTRDQNDKLRAQYEDEQRDAEVLEKLNAADIEEAMGDYAKEGE